MPIETKTNWQPSDRYNYTDLNRVERTTRFLFELLAEYGYSANHVPRAAEWTMADIPKMADLDRYLGNIRYLLDVFSVLPTTPPLPDDMDGLKAQGANAIEQNLKDMYLLIQNMAAAFRHCGTFHSEQGGLRV